jgi:hypothetical protein
MNINEVPQDKKNFKDGVNAPKKVMYVTSDDGQYTQTQSDGWEAENLVLEQAWDDIEQQLKYEFERVKRKEVSPLAYYMVKSRMDIAILASYAGKWQWQVKRHMQPGIFDQLPEKMLQKYAAIFETGVDELRNLGQDKPAK